MTRDEMRTLRRELAEVAHVLVSEILRAYDPRDAATIEAMIGQQRVAKMLTAMNRAYNREATDEI